MRRRKIVDKIAGAPLASAAPDQVPVELASLAAIGVRMKKVVRTVPSRQ
jgi:hypothetical protein